MVKQARYRIIIDNDNQHRFACEDHFRQWREKHLKNYRAEELQADTLRVCDQCRYQEWLAEQAAATQEVERRRIMDFFLD